jgi:hypothetical protein
MEKLISHVDKYSKGIADVSKAVEEKIKVGRISYNKSIV